MDAVDPLKVITMKTKTFLLSFLLGAPLLATQNTDGTEYKAPRLAGDSLAIKPLEKPKNDEVSSLEEIFTKGKVKGLLRYSMQNRNSNYNTLEKPSSSTDRQGYSAFGGYLGFESAAFYNISAGVTFYTAQKMFNNDVFADGTLGGLAEENGKAKSYTALGEAFIKYKDTQNDLRFGRREMPNYRFISLSNIRFSPLTHQGATYENTTLKNTKFIFGYIDAQKNRNAEEFTDMVNAARVKENSSTGRNLIRGDYDPENYDAAGNYVGEDKAMYMFSTAWTPENFTAEVWDYYVKDFVNTIYLYTDYTLPVDNELALTFAAQYAKQDDVGDHVAGSVDTWFYGLKAQAAWKSGITAFASMNQVEYNENSYDGGTIFVRWGTPQMFNSFQTQDSELAGTKSYGVGVQFELGHMGIIPNTVIRFRHAYYDMPDALGDYFAAQDRSETTFDLRYSFSKNDGFGIFTEMKGLSMQLRVAYDNFRTDYDFDAYKNLHGFDFERVSDDFVDTRLYIDYLF